MTSRQDALEQIRVIAQRHGLTPEEITAAIQAQAQGGQTGATNKSGLIAKLFSYIGGIFVFAGIGTFIAMQWEHMASPARVVITLGSGFAAFLMGLAAMRDERYRRAATPLFLIAAVLEPTGMMVVFHEYAANSDPLHQVLATTSALAVQFGAAFRKGRDSALLFFALLFATGLCWAVFDLMEMDGEWAAVAVGVSLLSIAYGIDKTPFAAITPFWYLAGSIHFFIGAFDVLEGTAVEVLYLGICCFMIYVSVVCRSRQLLVTSTAAMLFYIGYFTNENFADVVGWPIAMILLGLAMLGLGAMAFKINQKYLQSG